MRIKTYNPNKKQDFKTPIINYVNKLPHLDHIKQQILEVNFFNGISEIYLKFPFLFSSINSSISKSTVTLLNIAGYLYHRSIILLDDKMDGDNGVEKDVDIIIAICQEETIKILSNTFELNAEFWVLWNQRRVEYLKGFHLDKVTREINSIEDFELLVDCKSAFGKVAIDCIKELDKEGQDKYPKLYESHKFFYCGFQILDDIVDLEIDIQHGQFNIANWFLEKKLNKDGQDYDLLDMEEKRKYLFISRTMNELFEKALLYFDKSEKAIANIPELEDWKIEIYKFYNSCLNKKLELEALLEKSFSEISKPSSFNMNKESCSKLALEYIIKQQQEDGSWNEYINAAGIGNVWATGFILTKLQQCERLAIDKSILSRAREFLVSSKQLFTWGYNTSWISDADSSTFAMLATSDTGGVDYWLKYRNSDGGFRTYNDCDELLSSMGLEEKDVSGWMSSHVCVTAAAYFLVSSVEEKIDVSDIEEFLILSINKTGVWDSYWWTSPIYSTSYLIRSLKYIKSEELKNLVLNSIDILFKIQNNDGSFGDEYQKSSAFYTGLFISSILDNLNLLEKYKVQIERSITFLKISQLEDGSWEETHAMRVPDVGVHDPQSVKNWSINTGSVNVRAVEFNRLFSTTVCLNALSKFH